MRSHNGLNFYNSHKYSICTFDLMSDEIEEEEEEIEEDDEEDDDEILYDISDTLEDIAEHNVSIIASLAEIKTKISKMDEIYEILKRIEVNTRKDA